MDAGKGFDNDQHKGSSTKGSVVLIAFLVLEGKLPKNLRLLI